MYQRIRAILKEKNLTPAQVERDLGWGNCSIKKIETSSPSVAKMISLANYLETPVNYILTGEISYDGLPEDENHLLTIFRNLSEKNQLRLIERAESLQATEQD